jgi:hypothetical protein
LNLFLKNIKIPVRLLETINSHTIKELNLRGSQDGCKY